MTNAVCVLAQRDARQRAMTRDALMQGRTALQLKTAESANELLEQVATLPRPSLVLLDHDLDGAEDALEALKADPLTRRIPVIVLGGPGADIGRAYDLGAAAYVTRPVTFLDLVDAMKALSNWWLDVVELPPAA